MIKIYRKTSAKLLAVSMLSFFLFYTGCTPSEQVDPAIDYSGEEIFRGLFFWEGTLANQMEVLKPGVEQLQNTMDASQRKEYNEFQVEIIKQIKLLDSDYFDNLKTSMQSENLYEIELALANAQTMFQTAGRRSKFSGAFDLLTEIKEKEVDLDADKFKNLDLTNDEDAKLFAQIFKDDYGIEVGDNTVAGRGHCLYLAVSVAGALYFVVAGNAVIAVNASVAWNVAYAWNLNWSSNYQIPRLASDNAMVKALVGEIASVVN